MLLIINTRQTKLLEKFSLDLMKSFHGEKTNWFLAFGHMISLMHMWQEGKLQSFHFLPCPTLPPLFVDFLPNAHSLA